MRLAFLTMKRIRIAVRPPERTPPTPRTFVKEAEFVNVRIKNRTNGIEIVKSQALNLDILKSSLKVSVRAIDNAR